MANWLRTHPWHLGLSGLALVVFVAGLVALRQTPSEASASMPPAYRAYWDWVGSIGEGAEAALDPGLELLRSEPSLRLLYLRLAEVCLDAEAVARCHEALRGATPPDSLTALYREAALARLQTAASRDTTGQAWQRIAADPHLDPGLARLVVDQGKRRGQGPWLAEVEAAWRRSLEAATEDENIGAAFGLGYLAALRSEWDEAERLLDRVTAVRPDDPHAWREFGRIYFFEHRPDDFERVLQKGIDAAIAQHDVAQELILSGNLGWHVARNGDDLERAEQLISTALAQSQALADEETAGFNYYRLATVYLRQYRYDQALALLDSADVRYGMYAPHRQSEVWEQRGKVLSRMRRISDAEAELERAIAEAERRRAIEVKVRALNELGLIRYRGGRFSAGREASLQALQLAQRYRLRRDEGTARIIMARIERISGNLEAATQHFETALELTGLSDNSMQRAMLNQELGRTALLLKDPHAAQFYFEASLDTTGQNEQTEKRYRTLQGLGNSFAEFGNYTEAIRYYDLALAELEEGEDDLQRSRLFIDKAWALIYLGNSATAVRLLEADVERNGWGKGPLTYNASEALAYVALREGRYAEALEHVRRASRIDRQAPRPSRHWRVMFVKALALWRLGRTAEAETAFENAIGTIEALRENLSSSVNRASFVQDKVEVFEYFAAFLEAQGRSDEALHFTERARSRSLVDLLYTTQQERRTLAGRGTDQLIEMNRRVQALAQDLSEDAFDEESFGPASAGNYESMRLAQLRQEYQRVDSMYRQARIDLKAGQELYTFSPLPADSVQRLLAPGEALVLFDVRQSSVPVGEIAPSVAYLVLPDEVVAIPLAVQEQALAQKIRAFRESLGDTKQELGTNWQPWARRLYDDLIAPVAAHLPETISHLHLVPEGVMHYLPFAALQTEAGRFLVEDFTLSVAPSATLLSLTRQHNPRRWRSMLLLGDPGGSLPGARGEVRAVAAAGSSKRRHALVGAEVTQDVVEERAAEYDILHFATHGRFDARAPWRSYLELHGDEALTVEEIGRLNLDAYLVTLSACESALSSGQASVVPNGDEWVGFSQAFLAAGTPSVMATLWPIDDRVSGEFMVAFYEALGPAGKGSALAKVQRAFIRNSLTTHPFFWAPFVVIGDPL